MQVSTFLNPTLYTTKKDTKDVNVNSAHSIKNVDQSTLHALGSKAYFMQFRQEAINTVFNASKAQAGIYELFKGDNFARSILSNIDFQSLAYNGKHPLTMNANELKELVSEDGFFGVQNTAKRIADFVIQGAGNDLEKLNKGFEGMKQGFEQAERIWGQKLPQLSQDTITAAIKKLSDRIDELGGKSLDFQA